MSARIIDGNAVSRKIRSDCAERVARLRAERNVTPSLAVIIVGDDQASRIYVRNKMKAAEDVGVISRLHDFAADADPDLVLHLIDRLNDDPLVHGILVQLPLPPQFNIYSVLHRIHPRKDVDGFHLYNVGGLVVGRTVFSPCTPYGVMKLLQHVGIEVAGQNAVIVGASNIVGKPMALMLMQQEATVAICHARTRDLAQFTILADILVVAAGVPGLIVPQMVKSGAVVIDVGINRLPSGKIVGDVDFEGVRGKASYITPVPGGVGPMTVTMLISNTILSAEQASAAPALDDPFARADIPLEQI
ncbi:MAG: bifunctional methylenetetrahydrofolate dehydrogenase/methenyltetrahydrofolate cyclohydrolase FolD [Rhizobiales bacterium]|nr:bifunctional methylenetetrahydrofolate dehydrogenase/methenyltetrahydrofolate cyclohydrolase FolD [Hyphomicrobiales bacterium]OJU30073.1 MAG: bifunctional methylenetetrahydrofolate dehydrogenase/methenyltetrahydrofolate cyclohydrolase [Rhizobiales bacterium 68-8]